MNSYSRSASRNWLTAVWMKISTDSGSAGVCFAVIATHIYTLCIKLQRKVLAPDSCVFLFQARQFDLAILIPIWIVFTNLEMYLFSSLFSLIFVQQHKKYKKSSKFWTTTLVPWCSFQKVLNHKAGKSSSPVIASSFALGLQSQRHLLKQKQPQVSKTVYSTLWKINPSLQRNSRHQRVSICFKIIWEIRGKTAVSLGSHSLSRQDGKSIPI